MTTINNYRSVAPRLQRRVVDAAQFKQAVLTLWSAKQDTYEIAIAIGCPEWQVANELPHFLARRSQELEQHFTQISDS